MADLGRERLKLAVRHPSAFGDLPTIADIGVQLGVLSQRRGLRIEARATMG